jgi:hypothetical protein
MLRTDDELLGSTKLRVSAAPIVSVPLPNACQVRTALLGAVTVSSLPRTEVVTPVVVCRFAAPVPGRAQATTAANTNNVVVISFVILFIQVYKDRYGRMPFDTLPLYCLFS